MANSSKHRDVTPPSSSNPVGVIVAIVLIAIVVMLAFLAYLSREKQPTDQQFAQSISLDASAESAPILIGTLAPLGSFEYETSPLVNRLAVVLRHAGDAYLRHEISRDAASEVKSESESAYAVIAQATQLCHPAPHTGKCRGSREKVDELLEQAQAVVGSVPDYSPGISYTGR